MATKEQNLKRLDELALILGREPDISGSAAEIAQRVAEWEEEMQSSGDDVQVMNMDTVAKGKTTTLTVTVEPENATDKTFRAISADPSKATISVKDMTITVTGVKDGKVSIPVISGILQVLFQICAAGQSRANPPVAGPYCLRNGTA